MRIAEKTPERLVLVDSRADKRLALILLGLLLCGGAVVSAWNGAWVPVALLAAALAGLAAYARLSRSTATLTLDRTTGQITQVTEDRRGTHTRDWPLADIETAAVSTVGRRDTDSGRHCPTLVLTDGTTVPLRPWHSAGTQSWETVAAIRLFLGQRIDDAPTGWISPEDFDRHFAEELKAQKG